jgi:TonB family protein
MEAFAFYLLKSVIWLTGFAIVYFLFLQKERFFRLKRYYLIAGILISFIFPLFTFHYQVEIPAPEATIAGLFPTDAGIIPAIQPVQDSKQLDFRTLLLVVYLAGILLFAFNAIRQIMKLARTITRTKTNNSERAKLIRVSRFSGSFSFFNYVFINPSVDEKELEVIMNHELVHVNQKHWIDLVLVELLRTIQWINPFAWIYNGFIRQNHEYIADEVAIQQTPDPGVYKAVLVNQLFGSKVFNLSNSFNYSLDKKRFDMMKKIVASPYRKLRLLIVLPVFAIVFYAFASPEYNYVTSSGPEMNPSLTSVPIQKEAKGIVVNDEGKPLQGVSIVIAKSLSGAITDAKGRFAVSKIPDGSSLIFSCKGYKTYTMPPLIASNSALYIRLVKDPDYKEQAEIRIRNADGSEANPLIVVDGVINEKQDLKEINPNAIVSISVLKDEASIDKYGDKGKDGVIEITTNEQKTVKGIVVNAEGQPVEGVAINTTGTAGNVFATTTGKDGRFELNFVQADASIQLYFRGYKLLSVKPDFSKEMSIKMEKDPDYKAPASVQRPNPIVVIDGVITDKNFQDAVKELGYNRGPVKNIFGKEAIDKYGEKGANGVMEITTRKKASEMGLNPPYPRLAPQDFPTFGGKDHKLFNDWVTEQVKYPPEATAKNAEGYVTVSFTIEMDGTITNIKSASATDPLLSNEVIRAIRTAPRWDRPKNSEISEPFNLMVTVGFKLPDQIVKQLPFVVVQEMPVYPGGEIALLTFIADNTIYPEAAKADTIQGKVIVRFIVNTEGNTEGIDILKGVHPLLDAEAVRVVKKMSGFKPGMQEGKAVNVWYMVPVNFTLPYTKKN